MVSKFEPAHGTGVDALRIEDHDLGPMPSGMVQVRHNPARVLSTRPISHAAGLRVAVDEDGFRDETLRAPDLPPRTARQIQ